MNKDEALDLALEALDIVKIHFTQNRHVNEAITAIKQALAAQAAPVQPVAWIEHHKGGDNLEWDNPGGKCTALYTTPPAAQPAVQEPVVFYRCNGCGHAYEQVHPTSCDCMEAGGFDRVEYYTTPPAQPAPVQEMTNIQRHEQNVQKFLAAQPAVPDAIHHTDLSEHPQYIEGWNDCRAEMLRSQP